MMAVRPFWVYDVYDSTTDTFTPYTGPGEYRFSVQYCFSGRCSAGVDYNQPVTVHPLLPKHFLADDHRSWPQQVAPDQVRLNWRVDRTQQPI